MFEETPLVVLTCHLSELLDEPLWDSAVHSWNCIGQQCQPFISKGNVGILFLSAFLSRGQETFDNLAS